MYALKHDQDAGARAFLFPNNTRPLLLAQQISQMVVKLHSLGRKKRGEGWSSITFKKSNKERENFEVRGLCDPLLVSVTFNQALILLSSTFSLVPLILI